MQGEVSGIHGQETEGRIGQLRAIESTQPDAACFPGGNHQGQGHDVAVSEFPYFLFEGFDLLQVCDALEIADDDRLLRGSQPWLGKGQYTRGGLVGARDSPCATSARRTRSWS